MNKRTEGNMAEDTAARYLENKGHKILEKNFYCKFGEVDIISISPSRELVFTEVKFRRSGMSGDPLEAVTPLKQKKICRSSLFFISKNPEYSELQIRYDVIGIRNDHEISHIENAFGYDW